MEKVIQPLDSVECSHKAEVAELQRIISSTEKELSMIRDRYDSLCSKIKISANEHRNSEGDRFLRGYSR